MRILVVIGTRPEAIKMLPLVLELKKYEEFETLVCFSGQHSEMARAVFDEFKISPDLEFLAMQKEQSLTQLTGRLLNYFDVVLREREPDIVLVHGDTTTALCASIASFYLGIRVAHIEAGLRTFDALSPFPEEFNRVSIDALSHYHFAPTESAAENLMKEGRKSVFTVGNTVIDALEYSLSFGQKHPFLSEAKGRKTVLITTHRRENIGARIHSSLSAIRDIFSENDELFGVLPAHPNPRVREVVFDVLGDIKNIKICEPLGMREFHTLLSHAFAIFTDSGGIQEEAAHLGLPLFLLREISERRECKSLANVCYVGCDGERIKREFLRFLSQEARQREMRTSSNVFGDGKASQRIAKILSRLCGG